MQEKFIAIIRAKMKEYLIEAPCKHIEGGKKIIKAGKKSGSKVNHKIGNSFRHLWTITE